VGLRLFTGVYDIAWFAGSAALFSLSLTSVALFAVVAELAAIPLLLVVDASPPARRRRRRGFQSLTLRPPNWVGLGPLRVPSSPTGFLLLFPIHLVVLELLSCPAPIPIVFCSTSDPVTDEQEKSNEDDPFHEILPVRERFVCRGWAAQTLSVSEISCEVPWRILGAAPSVVGGSGNRCSASGIRRHRRRPSQSGSTARR
jgi:hypothetical protein